MKTDRIDERLRRKIAALVAADPEAIEPMQFRMILATYQRAGEIFIARLKQNPGDSTQNAIDAVGDAVTLWKETIKQLREDWQQNETDDDEE